MSFVDNHLHQTATYWRLLGDDGYGGHFFEAPEAISVRWEDSSEQYLTATGDETISKAKIFVDKDVEVGGYLALGSYSDDTPYKQKSRAFEIKRFEKQPDLRNLTSLRMAVI